MTWNISIKFLDESLGINIPSKIWQIKKLMQVNRAQLLFRSTKKATIVALSITGRFFRSLGAEAHCKQGNWNKYHFKIQY